MTTGIYPSEACRHLVLRLSAGAVLPDALTTALRDEKVASGWLRGSGVLSDVELRGYDAQIGGHGSTRRIEGPVQAVILEGSIGLSNGEPSLSLRAVLAREADRGLEVIAGEIGGARVLACEALVTALDDLTLERALDENAGVWLLGTASRGANPPHAPPRPPPRSNWSAALEASDRTERDPPRDFRGGSSGTAGGGQAVPARPPRAGPDLDTPFPEPGDVVDHFAFGRCDVVKSDGDRLHLKLRKDGRIREIALGMLRVSHLPDDGDGRRRFNLERKM